MSFATKDIKINQGGCWGQIVQKNKVTICYVTLKILQLQRLLPIFFEGEGNRHPRLTLPKIIDLHYCYSLFVNESLFCECQPFV
jgi:hypothetical protein